MHFVYVLRSEKDGRFYVGMTANVERRFQEHNKGRVFSTKGYCPWQLFFFEELPTRVAAREREKYLKSGVGKIYIKKKWSGSSVGYPPAPPGKVCWQAGSNKHESRCILYMY